MRWPPRTCRSADHVGKSVHRQARRAGSDAGTHPGGILGDGGGQGEGMAGSRGIWQPQHPCPGAASGALEAGRESVMVGASRLNSSLAFESREVGLQVWRKGGMGAQTCEMIGGARVSAAEVI